MRSHEHYRSFRRNEARAMVRKVRKSGLKATFREAFADAQTNWSRYEPLPKVTRQMTTPKPGKYMPHQGKREKARRRTAALVQSGMFGMADLSKETFHG